MPDSHSFSSTKHALLKKRLHGKKHRESGIATILQNPTDAPQLLSFAQQRLWFLEQFEGAEGAYTILCGFRLSAPLNIAVLQRSLHEIVRRHTILRATFSPNEGVPTIVIAPTLNLPFAIHDLRTISPERRNMELQRLAFEAGQHRFHLSEAPLFRFLLLRSGEEESILLVIVHHIIFDGWSMSVFIRELATLYSAFLQGKPSPLPELTFQYTDFAAWQRDWLKGENFATQLTYWKKQLTGSPPMLDLPTDYTRPVRQTFHGDIHQCTVPAVLVERLNLVSRQERSTLFMTLLAAFAVLLYRYSGQEDISVGSPVANRQNPEIERLIGFFVNMVVLRSDLSGNPTFCDLLQRIRQTTLAAQAHQDMPFDLLVEELRPERDLRHQPLFQVAFAFRNVPKAPNQFSGIDIKSIAFHNKTAKFDLFLEMVDTQHGLTGIFEYNTDLFSAETIPRISESFLILLHGIVADPEQRISALPILTDTERQQIVIRWNDTQKNYPETAYLHQLFERQVEQTPDAVAVVFHEQQFTYQELNQHANQVAHYLQRIKVGPEVLVGICMERSLNMIVGVLGILKAGGAYVPLDPDYPQERLAFMIEDAHIPFLLTQRKFVDLLSQHQATTICLDTEYGRIVQEEPGNPTSGLTASNLVYILYTSGSTGKPKGVAIEHHSPITLVRWALETFTTDQLAGVLASTSLCFDLSVFELFVPLSCGGKIILARNALELPGLSAKADITLINTVPSVMAELLQAEGIPDTVKIVNLAGEPLKNQLAQHIYQQHTHLKVLNLYGPSEDTTYSTWTEVKKGASQEPSIGRPIANTAVYILDFCLQPVPIGVAGELHIGGDGLARGYLNRPELTQEKFIPNPFSDDPHARLYKTGDLARYLPDGNIEFLGRLDHQVKIRGFRIELGEVESVLLQHPAVREAVVVARESTSGDKQLAAYVVVKQDRPVSARDLRDALKTQLPDYMIPAAFTFLENLPLTPNGKVDRRALPEPDAIRPETADTFVAPRTQAEESMMKLWRFLLNVDRIGIHDNFFEVGGHSLLAVKLMSEIETLFQVKLPLWKLFETPTIAGLVGALQEFQWQGPGKTVLAQQVIDPQLEALLDETIRPEKVRSSRVSDLTGGTAQASDKSFTTNIFLTGATGFLGAFLLHELLQQTQADIYCLVRARDEEDGRQRLRATLERYLIWSKPLAHRIIPIPGDLAQPCFGLTAEQFEHLAIHTGMIYHSGAQVNLTYPYAALKPVNVLGTQEVLRLAAHRTIKPVHYVSTTGVFPQVCSNRFSGLSAAAEAATTNPIAEDTPLPPFEALTIGYAQSKWVAEQMCTIAYTRGIPVSIYRPSRIAGHSQTGVWNTTDFACRMIKGCIQMQAAPEQQITTESWVPVDYVSRAIVHLSQQPASCGQVFHVVNRRPLDWTALIEWIASLGYPMQQLRYERWRKLLRQHGDANELAPLWPIFQAAEPSPDMLRFANWNTVAGLEGAAITCPRMDAALLHTYFAYFLRQQFLALPAKPV